MSIGKDRTILLICMGISLLSWVIVKLSKTYETSQTYRLEYHLPPGLQFLEEPVSSVRVDLSGSGWNLLSNYLFRQNPSVTFELSSLLKQEIPREELIARIEQANKAKATSLSRNYVSILLDTTASRRVPILLDADIKYSNDFYLRDSILLIPDSVTIYGSSQLLENISFLKTEKLVLNAPESDVRKMLRIKKPEHGHFELSSDETEVFIPVEQFTEKSFTVPIRTVNIADSVRILPAIATIKCLAGLSHFEELTASGFIIQADFEDVTDNASQTFVPLTLVSSPPWVRSVYFSPKSVEFLIIQ